MCQTFGTSQGTAAKHNNMIGGTDKAHSYARMPCTRANGDVCAIRSRPVPPIKYFCLVFITLHYTFDQSMSYSHIIDYLGKQYAEFNEHKYA